MGYKIIIYNDRFFYLLIHYQTKFIPACPPVSISWPGCPGAPDWPELPGCPTGPGGPGGPGGLNPACGVSPG